MQKINSFEPRYHELVWGKAGQVWVPIYNPVRACVREESVRLRAEGGVIDTDAWKMPWPVRRRVIEQKVERVGIEAMLWSFSVSLSALLFCGLYWAVKSITV